jgi:hypothetical protein
MTELRILLATVFLLLLSVFTLSGSVHASDDDRGESRTQISREDDGRGEREHRQEVARKYRAELRKKYKKNRHTMPVVTQTGTTST